MRMGNCSYHWMTFLWICSCTLGMVTGALYCADGVKTIDIICRGGTFIHLTSARTYFAPSAGTSFCNSPAKSGDHCRYTSVRTVYTVRAACGFPVSECSFSSAAVVEDFQSGQHECGDTGDGVIYVDISFTCLTRIGSALFEIGRSASAAYFPVDYVFLMSPHYNSHDLQSIRLPDCVVHQAPDTQNDHPIRKIDLELQDFDTSDSSLCPAQLYINVTMDHHDGRRFDHVAEAKLCPDNKENFTAVKTLHPADSPEATDFYWSSAPAHIHVRFMPKDNIKGRFLLRIKDKSDPPNGLIVDCELNEATTTAATTTTTGQTTAGEAEQTTMTDTPKTAENNSTDQDDDSDLAIRPADIEPGDDKEEEDHETTGHGKLIIVIGSGVGAAAGILVLIIVITCIVVRVNRNSEKSQVTLAMENSQASTAPLRPRAEGQPHKQRT